MTSTNRSGSLIPRVARGQRCKYHLGDWQCPAHQKMQLWKTDRGIGILDCHCSGSRSGRVCDRKSGVGRRGYNRTCDRAVGPGKHVPKAYCKSHRE
jgi:hypothetical protein